MVAKKVKIDKSEWVNRLDLICFYYYGFFSDELVDKIIEINPSVDFFDGLQIGTEIQLPDIMEIYVK